MFGGEERRLSHTRHTWCTGHTCPIILVGMVEFLIELQHTDHIEVAFTAAAQLQKDFLQLHYVDITGVEERYSRVPRPRE